MSILQCMAAMSVMAVFALFAIASAVMVAEKKELYQESEQLELFEVDE